MNISNLMTFSPVLKAVETFFTSPSRRQRPWTPESVLDSYGDTPDAIIITHILKTMAEDFDKVRYSNCTYYPRPGTSDKWISLSNKNKYSRWDSSSLKIIIGDLVFSKPVSRASKDKDGCAPYVFIKESCAVNGIEIIPEIGEMVVETYHRLKEHHDGLKAAAAQAEAAMKANEAKWNLAETLLGMRRDENGALVPVISGDLV